MKVKLEILHSVLHEFAFDVDREKHELLNICTFFTFVQRVFFSQKMGLLSCPVHELNAYDLFIVVAFDAFDVFCDFLQV